MPATLTKAPETTTPATPAAEPDYLAQAIAEELGADAPAPRSEDGGEGTEDLGSEEEETPETPDAPADAADAPDSEETDAAEGDESATEDDADEETDPRSKLPASVQKRIDGLTAEKKRLAEKLEAAEAELAKVKPTLEKLQAAPVTVSPTEADPLANILTTEELNQRITTAKAVKRWALENLEGGKVTNAQGEEVDMSPEDVRRHLAAADELLMDHAPRRAAYLRDLAAHDAEARKVYPALFEPQSEDFQEAVQTLRVMPELMRFPDWKLAVGDFITARRARLAKQQTAAKDQAGRSDAPAKVASAPAGAKPAPAPVSKPAPRVPDPTSPRRVTAPQAVKERIKKRAMTTGDDADLEAYFMAGT